MTDSLQVVVAPVRTNIIMQIFLVKNLCLRLALAEGDQQQLRKVVAAGRRLPARHEGQFEPSIHSAVGELAGADLGADPRRARGGGGEHIQMVFGICGSCFEVLASPSRGRLGGRKGGGDVCREERFHANRYRVSI